VGTKLGRSDSVCGVVVSIRALVNDTTSIEDLEVYTLPFGLSVYSYLVVLCRSIETG